MMLRLLLTLQFAAISLAGPWLCCCTAMGAHAGTTEGNHEKNAAKPSCTCHHTSGHDRRDQRRSPCDEAPCPAKRFRSQAMQEAGGVDVPESDEMSGFVCAGDGSTVCAWLQADPQRLALLDCALATPRESSRAILRALSVLRC